MAQYGADQQYGNPVHFTKGGTMGDSGSTGHHQRGTGTNYGTGLGSTGHRHSTGTTDYGTGGGYGTTGHQGLRTGGDYKTGGGTGTGGDYKSTGHHGAGTDVGRATGETTGAYQNQPSATPYMGGGSEVVGDHGGAGIGI